jgi:hypothetical protein
VAAWHALLYIIGVWPADTRWAAFWEGFGSGPIAWLSIPLAYVWHQRCHEPRCYRLGRHPVDGTPFKACRKHHPTLHGKPSKGHMTRAFLEARKLREQ